MIKYHTAIQVTSWHYCHHFDVKMILKTSKLCQFAIWEFSFKFPIQVQSLKLIMHCQNQKYDRSSIRDNSVLFCDSKSR